VSMLLGAISVFFWYWLRQGFNRKVIKLAVPLVGLYLVINGIVIGSGLWYLHGHPTLVARWWETVQQQVEANAYVPWLGMAGQRWSSWAWLWYHNFHLGSAVSN